MIEEILPGLAQWSAYHEGIGATVYSCLVIDSGTLIDPMTPEGGLEELERFGEPRRIVLSNRHHYRHSDAFSQRCGCPVLCQRDGLHELGAERLVEGFDFGEELAPDVRALELGSICPEETTLLLGVGGGGMLSFADGLTRDRDGSLAFMPDSLLGDEPQAVRDGLRANLAAMLAEDFDALRFAHAEPIRSGGRALLEAFLEDA
ncbi:MAG: MBL fold metallo-hydrolase [Solirubrobacteraceae bacterium]